MGKSKVYFADMHTTFRENLPQKLRRLILAAGIKDIDFSRRYAAIKLHFGEPGNLSFLRPNYAKVVADVVKELGGAPFLTDCNTLYTGRRKNALEHIDTAYENGFSPFSTGCNVIIGDGLKGTDEIYVSLDGKGTYVTEAKIGRAIMDADIFISLTHFKGHEATGVGGALKNIGMGCGSRAGKMEMHSNGKPSVDSSACVACGMCMKVCAHGAIAVAASTATATSTAATTETIAKKYATINHDKCVGCGRCIGVCMTDAIQASYGESNDILNMKIAEYSYAVLKDRPHFHISLVIDVSPFCDCHGENDVPIIPDVGMFASFDPVALDMACTDMANKQPIISTSLLSKSVNNSGDHFCDTHPSTNWRVALEHAEKLGLGSCQYDLINIL